MKHRGILWWVCAFAGQRKIDGKSGLYRVEGFFNLERFEENCDPIDVPIRAGRNPLYRLAFSERVVGYLATMSAMKDRFPGGVIQEQSGQSTRTTRKPLKVIGECALFVASANRKVPTSMQKD